MTRQRTIEFSAVVRRRLPLLTEATALVGHLPIRTRGTIGGSIAHADPSAEYPAVLTALDGAVVVRGPARRARRSVRRALPELPHDEPRPRRDPRRGAPARHGRRRRLRVRGVQPPPRRLRHRRQSPRCSSASGERCTTARLATAGAGPVPTRLRARRGDPRARRARRMPPSTRRRGGRRSWSIPTPTSTPPPRTAGT